MDEAETMKKGSRGAADPGPGTPEVESLRRELEELKTSALHARLLLEASARRLAFLATASRMFADAEADLPTLLGVIARQTALEFGDVAGLILCRRDAGRDTGTETEPGAQPGTEPEGPLGQPVFFTRDPEALEPLRRIFEGEATDPRVSAVLGDIVRTRQPFSWSRRILEVSGRTSPDGPEARAAAWLERFPIHRTLLVPLQVRDCVVGVLGWARGPSTTASSDDPAEERALLEQVAERAAMSIEKARLVADLNAVNAETDLLYELADSMNRAETLEGLYTPAVSAMAKQLGRLGLGRCALLLVDPDGVMRFKAWNGLSDRYRAGVEGHSPWTPTETRPGAIVVPDVRAAPELSQFGELFAAEDIRALAFIPLVHAGHLLGTFVLCSPSPRAFRPSHLRLARTIADQVADAVARTQSDAERERMIRELRRTVKSNELFAGILGHDLRNPLGAILMSATVLSRKTTDEGTGRTVARILSAGQRMNRMITQLLDFTRVRASGKLPIERAWTDIAPIFQQAIDELGIPSSGPGLKPELEYRGDTRGWWDADRLGQVASNLMSNAVRHGAPEHPVRVSIRAEAPTGVRITVRNGGTIPADLLPIIFDPFRRGELRERRGGGLGLGLFITREIVVAHRGNLAVACSDDETVFTVELPRGPEAEPASERAPAAPS
jgi:signal transduction histidine kinase